jgi:hypothetical protein
VSGPVLTKILPSYSKRSPIASCCNFMMRVRIGLARSVADSSLAKNRLLYKNTANDFAEQIMKLTPRQQEILDFIKNTVEVLGARRPGRKSPAFGFASPNAAEDHLKALAKKGAINLEPVRRGASAWSSNSACR